MFVVLYIYIYVTLYNHLRIGVFNVDSYPSIPLYPIKCSQHNIPNSWLVHFRPAPPRQPWAVCPWECSSLSRGAVVNHIIHTYIYIIIYIYISNYVLLSYTIEGSLEVKLPTIWTDEKQRWEESEKRREERRSEKRKSQVRRQKMRVREKVDARKGRKVPKHCVFSNDLWLRGVEK